MYSTFVLWDVALRIFILIPPVFNHCANAFAGMNRRRINK
jgi:hypothetical protein